MVAGNVFQIFINDGIEDVLLYAKRYLNKRMGEMRDEKLKVAIDSQQKSFEEDSIDNQEYDRFMADPEEWVRRKHGFNIEPNLYDVAKTHGVYINSCYKPFAVMAYAYFKANEKRGKIGLGSETTFKIPLEGQWVSDMVLHIQLKNLKTTSPLDKVKYCDLLGHRLVKKVTLLINEKEISSYGTEYMNKYYQLDLNIDKKLSWLRNIGQEIPVLGYLTPDPKKNEFREYKYYGDGPQTFKREHSEVDIWLPLLFWFNKDIAEAFPNGKLPYLAMEIKVELNELELISIANNLGGGGGYSKPSIDMDLFTNQITTTQDLSNMIFSKHYDLNLIRIIKEYSEILTNPYAEIKFDSIKYPVEHFSFAARPVINETNIDVWHRCVKLVRVNIRTPVIIDSPSVNSFGINYAYYFSETPILDEIGFKVAGQDVIKSKTMPFYSSYTPNTWKGFNAPVDRGYGIINFQQRPDIYDPSGWINLSRNRDAYLSYKSSYINNTDRAKLYISAQCINFLMIKKDSTGQNHATLKFI